MTNSSPMSGFYNQHADLAAQIKRIEDLLLNFGPESPSAPMRDAFHQLSAKLRIHLAMEDNALYPRLLQHSDPQVRGLAQKFQTEMGGLRDAYEAFLKEWLILGAFAKDPAAFIRVVTKVFGLLKARVQREETELYPLAARTS